MKSHNETLLELAVSVLKDFTALAVYSPFERDLLTLRSRVKNEGISFLTITLPSFGDDFFSSLENGRIDSKLFRSFRKSRQIPAFLQGIVSRVFDRDTGALLDTADLGAIKHIRQISYMFKKIKIDCTKERYNRAIEKYVEEEEIFDTSLSSESIKEFSDICRVLWDPYLHCSNFYDDITNNCKHGPGGTADGLKGNKKYTLKIYHDRLEQYFPFLGTVAPLSTPFKEVLKVDFRDAELEQPVKVIAVPKTLKTPRIIAMEPTCMQYAQQAISAFLIKTLERHPIAGGQINFTCQDVNQSLALWSSKNRHFATLDLSSASDRVPRTLALAMFAANYELQEALDAARSTKAQLPDGRVIGLRKFASMGSATCFPVEAMYFYTLCILGCIRDSGAPVTYESVKRFGSEVYVYGDDIIVPIEHTATVIRTLHEYYCKVGVTKSFWRCYFRESCGMDAYDGEEITPIYIRTMRPDDRREDSDKLISWVATSNQLFRQGYWKTSQVMIERCEQLLGSLPITGNNSPGLGKTSFLPMVSYHRWSKKYHCAQVRAWVPEPIYQKDSIDGYHALAKSLTSLERVKKPITDRQHLKRSARHGTAKLKCRWVAPF